MAQRDRRTATGELTREFYHNLLYRFALWLDDEPGDLYIPKEKIGEFVDHVIFAPDEVRDEVPHMGVRPEDVNPHDSSVMAFWAGITGMDAAVHIQRLDKQGLEEFIHNLELLLSEAIEIHSERGYPRSTTGEDS